VEYLRGLRRIPRDPDWVSKILMGCLLLAGGLVVPIIGAIVGALTLRGWSSLALRRAVRGEESPVLPPLEPDFDYCGKLVVTGLKASLAWLAWMLPVLLVVMPAGVCGLLGAAAAIIAALEPSDADAAIGIGMIAFYAIGLVILWGTLLLLSSPAQIAMIRVEVADDLDAGLALRPVLETTRTVLRELVLGSIVLALVQIGASIVSLPFCGLPLMPVTVAMHIARAHLGAQLYLLSVERGGAPLAIGPTSYVAVPPPPPAPPPPAPPGDPVAPF
jgi:hypothetical protein